MRPSTELFSPALTGFHCEDIDAGNYILQDTLYIPAGTFVVGEVWPVLTGSGPKFQNKLLPRPVVQVGLPGQTAPTEISEVLFSTTSGSSGAIVLEWNVGESSQASAAMWDSHFRLGGYIGSGMQDSNCLAGTFNYAECTAAYLSLWVTPLASAYFEVSQVSSVRFPNCDSHLFDLLRRTSGSGSVSRGST